MNHLIFITFGNFTDFDLYFDEFILFYN